jgi:hypothetical protein
MTREDTTRYVQRPGVDQPRRLTLPPHLPGWVICIAAVVSVGILLAGCASMQQHIGGWFGAATPTATPEPTPTPQGTPEAAAPRVYYAGIEGMKVRGGSSASSKVIGQLSLHERVTRFRLERGYAYVESAESATKGWVNNSQLIWRLPSEAATAAPPSTEPEPEAPAAPATESQPGEPAAPTTEPETEEPGAPAAEEPEVPEAPEATETVAEPTPTPTNTTAASPPSPKPTPRGAAPSIFDAY